MKANNDKDGQEIFVDTDIKLSPDDALKKFGEAFHHVAFGSMKNYIEENEDGDETVTRFGYSTKKPPKWLKPSVHSIDLWGNKQKGQPKIQKL